MSDTPTRLERDLLGEKAVPAADPVIGYDRATALAKEAMQTGRGILDLVREKRILNEAQIAQVLDPVAMTGQGRAV